MNMMTYRDRILGGIEGVNAADPNWGWHLVDIERDTVSVRWDYLDYIGQKSNFRISYHKDGTEEWLTGDLGNDFIDDSPVVTIGESRWDDAKDLGSALVMIIGRIARIAHSRY